MTTAQKVYKEVRQYLGRDDARYFTVRLMQLVK